VVFGAVCLGLGMLLFVAQFLDFLSTTMSMLVLVALVHGVYVVRSGRGAGKPKSESGWMVSNHGKLDLWCVYIYIILYTYLYMGKFHHDLTVLPKPGIMVNKENHPQMAFIQVRELLYRFMIHDASMVSYEDV
jgi:hypothetical protein